MTLAQLADAVGMVADAVSNVLPGHWGPVADAVGTVADTAARHWDMTELISKGTER
ncbi:hypothetical protein ACWC0C_07085 [Streptomyces sp. NPDC001709]